MSQSQGRSLEQANQEHHQYQQQQVQVSSLKVDIYVSIKFLKLMINEITKQLLRCLAKTEPQTRQLNSST